MVVTLFNWVALAHRFVARTVSAPVVNERHAFSPVAGYVSLASDLDVTRSPAGGEYLYRFHWAPPNRSAVSVSTWLVLIAFSRASHSGMVSMARG